MKHLSRTMDVKDKWLKIARQDLSQEKWTWRGKKIKVLLICASIAIFIFDSFLLDYNYGACDVWVACQNSPKNLTVKILKILYKQIVSYIKHFYFILPLKHLRDKTGK